VLIEDLLFKAEHGIVDQSLHARLGAEPTNGDGFGLGVRTDQVVPVLERGEALQWRLVAEGAVWSA
jgi:predicted glutamine amidotransferase